MRFVYLFFSDDPWCGCVIFLGEVREDFQAEMGCAVWDGGFVLEYFFIPGHPSAPDEDGR